MREEGLLGRWRKQTERDVTRGHRIRRVTWAHIQIVTESGWLIDGIKILPNRSDIVKVICWGIQLYNMKAKVPVARFSGWWIWKWTMFIWIIKDRGYRHTVLNITCKTGISCSLKEFKILFLNTVEITCGNSYSNRSLLKHWSCFHWTDVLFLFT